MNEDCRHEQLIQGTDLTGYRSRLHELLQLFTGDLTLF